MRRPIWAYLFLFGLFILLGSFTWLTWNPDAEVLDRAERWPVFGSLAARFKAIYRQPGDRPPVVSDDTAEASADGEAVASSRVRFSGQVYVLKGQELKVRPDVDSPTMYRFDRHTRAGKIGRRGDWYHVHYLGRAGWLLLENYDESAEVPYGDAAELPVPVAARAPDPERLEAVRKYLRGRERAARIGPYDLYTDSRDESLIAFLDAVVAPLDEVYAQRFGRAPIGVPAEAVVLYESDIAYRLLQRQTEQIAGLASAGHNSKGVAVLYVGGRSRFEVAATLIHELVHFINRRAVGPQLPPWLDEGLADALAQARIDEDSVIHPAELGGERSQQEQTFRLEGGFSTLWHLREASRDGGLPEIEGLTLIEWENFVQPERSQLYYGASAFWVRFLLDGGESRRETAFRDFLSLVAVGEPPTAEVLQATLGEEWDLLNADFAAWIERLAASSELPDDVG